MIDRPNERLPSISRRDFLKQMSLIGVGLGLPAVSEEVIEAADKIATRFDGEAVALSPSKENCFEPPDVVWKPGGYLIIDGQQRVPWLMMEISSSWDRSEFSLDQDKSIPMAPRRRTKALEFYTSEPIIPMPGWTDTGGPFSIEVYPNETDYCFMVKTVWISAYKDASQSKNKSRGLFLYSLFADSALRGCLL